MIKGINYRFPNGETYTIPPLSLGALELIQEGLGAFDGTLSKQSVQVVVQAVYLALKRNYPEMSVEKVKEDLLDLGCMLEAMQAVMDVGGLRAKAQQGEPLPVEEQG